MSSLTSDTNKGECETLHMKLLDAVRSCQTNLGGKQQLVSESSSWVSCLCTQIEVVLQHRLKTNSLSKGLLALKQVTVGSVPEEIVFWHFIRNHLTQHEIERFEKLVNITTDVGRGRAWLRSSLNEHSLERYFYMIIGDVDMIKNYYEDGAFLLDEERASTLPQMAAGLASIYFNIRFDNPSLNGSPKPMPNSLGFIPNILTPTLNNISYKTISQPNNENIDAKYAEKVKKRSGKQKKAKIITFGGDDTSFDGLSVTSSSTRGESGKVVTNRSISSKSSNISVSSVNSDDLYEIARPAPQVSQKINHDSIQNGFQNQNSKNAVNAELTRSVAGVALHPENSELSHESSPKPGIPSFFSSPLKEKSSTKNKKLKDQENENGIYQSAMATQNLDQVLPKKGEVEKMKQQLLAVKSEEENDNHDLVMDGWSVRSNSVPLRVDNSSSELYLVHDDDDFYSQSIEEKSENFNTNEVEVLPSFLERKANTQAHEPTSSGQKLSFDAEQPNNNSEDLRQALVAVMQRKDEVEQANKSIRGLLDTEMEHSAGLRLEIEKLQMTIMKQVEESTSAKQQAQRENDILRNQLKKYVGAVQALQKEGKSNELAVPNDQQSKELLENTDVGAEVYEKKLIEVAEMHGELMEFNERLHKRLQSSISLLHNMRTELVDLRGPMATDDRIFQIENDNISTTVESFSRALINIWMPSVYQKGKGPDSHHVYQVYIRISDEEWNIYRRYSHFHELHIQIRKKYPIIDTYAFPPKKTVGNKGTKFVELRRKGLQSYLRLLMNSVVQNHEKIVARPTKQTLITLLPFFSETMITTEDPTASKGKFSILKSRRK